MGSNPCPEHVFAVPLSWKDTMEFKNMLKTFSRVHGNEWLGYQTYPSLCPKCKCFEFGIDKRKYLVNLKGSL